MVGLPDQKWGEVIGAFVRLEEGASFDPEALRRHSPEGLNFKRRVEDVGWKQAVRERDSGGFDWTRNRPADTDEN